MENAKVNISRDERARIGRLNDLNARFYTATAASFSETRQRKWPGWDELAAFLARNNDAFRTRSEASVTDLACGNMRFESFLRSIFTDCGLRFSAIDNCIPLANVQPSASNGNAQERTMFVACDLIDSLVRNELGSILPTKQDLAVCFGFFHHIPTQALRKSLLRNLISSLNEKGTCCISLWRFMDDARIAKKARATTQRAIGAGRIAESDLEENDYLLGWQERSDVFRFCHHLSAEETAELIESVEDIATLRLRYQADGKTENLNTYLVFEKR